MPKNGNLSAETNTESDYGYSQHWIAVFLSIVKKQLVSAYLLEGKNGGGSVMNTERQKELVCIVDDAIHLMTHVKDFLEFSGFQVETADNGETGVEVILANNPGAVLVDMQMPGVSGLEVIERVRSEGYTGHIIVATGHTSDEDKQACLSSGADEFLTKPYSLANLEQSIKKATSG